MLRKPYVIGGHMYSNGVRKYDVAAINSRGYLATSPWVRADERAAWVGSGTASTPELTHLRGELMFRGQCLACHTIDGYRSIRGFLQGRDRASIGNVVRMLHQTSGDSPYRAFMPPLVGTDAEVEALTDYLHGLVVDTPRAVRR